MKITISTAQGTQTTYEYEQLAQMWKDGMLKAETLYWKEGMTDWKPLGELFAGLAPPPLPSGNPSPGRKISQMKRVNPQNGSTGIREKKFEKREGYSGKAFLSIISLILFYVGSNVFGNANSGFVLFATISLLLLAIILGHFARKDVKNKNLKGGWLALTTLILGYVSLLLVLLGIVAGLAMSNMGEIFGGGKQKAAQTWVNSTGEAYVTSYFALVGEYPNSLSDLKSPPPGTPPFVKRETDLQDPWGNEYRYQYPGEFNQESFDIWTVTPEGEVIGNWINALEPNS